MNTDFEKNSDGNLENTNQNINQPNSEQNINHIQYEVPYYLREGNGYSRRVDVNGYDHMYTEPKKKRRGRKLVAVLLVLVLFAGIFGGLAAVYQIVPGTGDMVFSIVRRNSGSYFMEVPQTQDETPSSGNQRPAQGNKDGPKVVISDVPSNGNTENLVSDNSGVLTIPQIAKKVTPSTVGVISKVASVYGSSVYSGTGIIMSEDGYIITNNHVISGSNEISITLIDGSTYDAVLIGADSRSDLAVVKIEAKGLIAAEFGDSDRLEVGELAVAIGNPLGLELMGTVTDGIISAINRDVLVEGRNMTLIQTNAAINSGNSGGPLINKYGQVIGINTLKMQDFSTSIEGLGFAIPTNTAKEIVDELIEFGYIKGRPTIGITQSRTISAMQARYYNLPEGVIVDKLSQNSDAYMQGLKINDIIVKAQGKDAKTTTEINAIKEEFRAGDSFTLTVYREGKYIDITFKLMDEAELDMADETSLIP